MYIRIVEKPGAKKSAHDDYSEDIKAVNAFDLREIRRAAEDAWKRSTKTHADETGYGVYDDKDVLLVKGDIRSSGGELLSITTDPVCSACGADLKTPGQFMRKHGSTESEESRRKIYYACMNEGCEKHFVNIEMLAQLSA